MVMALSLLTTVESRNLSSVYADENPFLPSVRPLAVVLGSISVLSLLANVIFLVLSRYVSGGRTWTLVYVRCLCVSDLGLALYGLIKCAFIRYPPTDVSRFLPDCVFLSAVVASHFTLCVMLEKSYKFHSLLGRSQVFTLNMTDTITSVVIGWNFSVFIGCLPLMGWSDNYYSSYTFAFYSTSYLAVVCVVLIAMMTVAGILTIAMYRHRIGAVSNADLVAYPSVMAGILDVILHFTVVVPWIVYMLLHCWGCVLQGRAYADTYYLVVLVLFEVKAILGPCVRLWGTGPMRSLVRHYVVAGWFQCCLRANTYSMEAQPETELSDLSVASIRCKVSEEQDVDRVPNTVQPANTRDKSVVVYCNSCGHRNVVGSTASDSQRPAGDVKSYMCTSYFPLLHVVPKHMRSKRAFRKRFHSVACDNNILTHEAYLKQRACNKRLVKCYKSRTTDDTEQQHLGRTNDAFSFETVADVHTHV